MLVSYAKAIRVMLKLPPDHPHNWFRNAFVHFMDCPHGNWWFYVWHRGYIGYFEQTIRALSNDQHFTLPFWDWSKLPRIPAGMFVMFGYMTRIFPCVTVAPPGWTVKYTGKR